MMRGLWWSSSSSSSSSLSCTTNQRLRRRNSIPQQPVQTAVLPMKVFSCHTINVVVVVIVLLFLLLLPHCIWQQHNTIGSTNAIVLISSLSSSTNNNINNKNDLSTTSYTGSNNLPFQTNIHQPRSVMEKGPVVTTTTTTTTTDTSSNTFNDDDITSIQHVLQQENHDDRELYSYDDTYYSDIHFYSNDDDGTTTTSSSSSNSAYNSKATKILPSNIDWTSYALKYVSCANVKTWRTTTNDYYDNDDDGDNMSDILVQRTLVVVRLCPATLCSSYNVKGCNKDYGEYVMPASNYLQIIHTYYINQASIEKYCSVCSACMSYVTNSPTTSPTTSPTVYKSYDDYYNRDRRQLAYGDDYFNDDAYGSSSSYKYKPWYLDDNYQCMYQNVCSKYTSKCKKYLENNNDDTTGTSGSTGSSVTTATMTNTTFGQCIAFRGDGSGSSSNDYYYYYASPHCAADGRTLHVGLYADPNCTIYVKSTGSSNPFATYTSGLSCLSCNYYDSSESSYALIPDTAIILQSSNDTSSSSLLSTNHPLCSNLYNTSAHCNTKLTPFTNRNNNSTMILSNYTTMEDEVVCPYIESLEDNMYDAYGDVVLLKSSMYGLFSPFWRKGNGVASDEDNQKSTNNNSMHRSIELGILFASMCIFCSLSIHAYTLRKKLLSRKFISWTSPSPLTTSTTGEAILHHPPSTNTNYYATIFPFWNDSKQSRPTLNADINRIDSGIGITRSYEAPNYSLGSYDSENFIVPTKTTTTTGTATATTNHRPVYQPYGGTIPQRHNNTTAIIGSSAILPPPSQRTTTTTMSSSASVVRFQQNQNVDDHATIQNNVSLEYMDRNTGRFA